MRLTWSKQPSERGLAGVCQSPRGRICKVDGEEVARVVSNTVGFHVYRGWFWVARNNSGSIPLRNTYDAAVQTIEEAMIDAEQYVRECLKAK